MVLEALEDPEALVEVVGVGVLVVGAVEEEVVVEVVEEVVAAQEGLEALVANNTKNRL